VPPAALLNIIQKGLQYTEAEISIAEVTIVQLTITLSVVVVVAVVVVVVVVEWFDIFIPDMW